MKTPYDQHSYRFCKSFARVHAICPFTAYFSESCLSTLGDNGAFDGIPVDSTVINGFNVAWQVFSENSI